MSEICVKCGNEKCSPVCYHCYTNDKEREPVASPQATRPERICGNCGLPLVQGETEEMCRELDKVSTRLEKARAVAPVETPNDIPTHFVKWENAKKGEDGVYREAVETRQFLSSWLEPNPNEPDEDTYWLRFPNGVECVENRAFWEKHLAELLEAFRDKSESELRDQNERLVNLNRQMSEEKEEFRGDCIRLNKEVTGLREEIERLKARNEAMIQSCGTYLRTERELTDQLTELRPKLAEQVKEITRLKLQYTVAHCWWDDDTRRDSAEEHADELGLKIGAEFTLQASTYWDETFRVTVVPDASHDDYVCEQISEQREEFETYHAMEVRAEAAEAEAAALRERERWIPVEEKLPEDGTSALIFVPDWEDMYLRYRVAWINYDEASPEWIFDGHAVNGVTHWKALSAAPERGKGEK